MHESDEQSALNKYPELIFISSYSNLELENVLLYTVNVNEVLKCVIEIRK